MKTILTLVTNGIVSGFNHTTLETGLTESEAEQIIIGIAKAEKADMVMVDWEYWETLYKNDCAKRMNMPNNVMANYLNTTRGGYVYVN